jgi:hypothetical protein
MAGSRGRPYKALYDKQFSNRQLRHLVLRDGAGSKRAIVTLIDRAILSPRARKALNLLRNAAEDALDEQLVYRVAAAQKYTETLRVAGFRNIQEFFEQHLEAPRDAHAHLYRLIEELLGEMPVDDRGSRAEDQGEG